MRKIFSLSRVQRDFKFLVLILLLILQWTNPSLASPGKPSQKERKLVPAPLLYWPEEGSDYAILVDKSAQKVFLYRWDNLLAPLKVYNASTGENNGPKSRRNDKKTPEGVYFFTGSYKKNELAPRYGTRALPIDYPNPMDKKKGRDGYGIWFHGLDKPLKPMDTNGCIALDNTNIDELATYIQLHDTPVVISSRIEMVSPGAREKERKQLLNVIEGWRRAWERKEIDEYMSFYGPRFRSDGKNREQWKKYKALVANKYDRITVKIENLRLLKNDGIVLAKFDQRYSTERLESKGEKRLYLQQNSTEWKIVGEFFHKEKVRRFAPKKPRPTSLEDIRRFISSWKKAWEEKDLHTYMLCYDAGFRSRGMDLKAWKKHRQRLNRKYHSVKVEVMDISIVQVSNWTAKVSFKQNYQADAYQDFGLKNLLLVKRGEHWKIKEEEWHRLIQKSRP
ncbi:MAG: L,D-transpeptidase family protein [Desulfobacteraceae bacterium]